MKLFEYKFITGLGFGYFKAEANGATVSYEYKFVKQGASAPGSHCSFCPQGQVGNCALPCSKIYEALLAEREADGVKVNDTPDDHH